MHAEETYKVKCDVPEVQRLRLENQLRHVLDIMTCYFEQITNCFPDLFFKWGNKASHSVFMKTVLDG